MTRKPTMKTLISSLVASICLALTACGGDAIDDDDDDDVVTTFTCDGRDDVVCDTAKGEVCIYQLFSGSDEHHTQECIVAEPTCTTCECAQAAAVDFFGDATNCSNAERCGETNGAFTVGCRNAPL